MHTHEPTAPPQTPQTPEIRDTIVVTVTARFIEEQSDTSQQRYVFSYDVSITNNGPTEAQLIGRHWIITDGNDKVQKVSGDGVIGQQPHIAPGETFNYTSGAVLDTPVGSMHGTYDMRAEDTMFLAKIPVFTLASPNAIH